MGDLIAISYPKYYVQVSGKDDNLFPFDGAKEVFAAGKRVWEEHGIADRCQLVVGNAGHRFYADDAWPIVHKMLGK